MTYSLAGRCPDSGQIGFSVTTSSVCVGARVGAVTENCVVFSQARTDPRLHAVGLKTWAETANAEATLATMQSAAHALHWRQLGVFPMVGTGLHHTGTSCLDHCGGLTGQDCLALGNFLGTADVLPAMVQRFEETKGPLAERLMGAMIAGEMAGSERDPLQSAAIIVRGTEGLKDVDRRIDASTDPLANLNKLLSDWMHKSAAYRLRAIDPDSAPSSSDVEHS